MRRPAPQGDGGTRAPSAPNLPLRTFLTIAALLGIFLFAGWCGYRAYLASPDVVSATPLPSRHPATAERAVVFVIDAFTPAKAFEPGVMPTMVRLAAEGASGTVQTGTVTTTAPCVYSLTTGRPGSLVQAIFNFHSSETRVDSLLSTMAAAGGGITLAGDPAWHRQFGWLVPEESRHESPEPGITVEHHIDAYDSADVDFILAKLRDPHYRLFILHLGSLDAVGHMVTPMVPRYEEQMRFLDGLVARAVAAIDRKTTLLLVTGDHGMAPRGTHGGEEEARLTPYALVGPGVRAGVKLDVPQTALTSTLSALLGLPFLPVSQYPPVAAILDRSPADLTALAGEYFAGKRSAATALTGDLPAADRTDDEANRVLNEVLFGAEDSRAGLRMLAGAVTLIGVLATAFLVWRSAPRGSDRPHAVTHLVVSAAAPLGLALAAATFIWMRGAFAFPSTTIATAIVAILLVAAALATWLLLRSPRLLSSVGSWQLSLFFPVLIVLTAPLVNSHWLRPRPYFELLLLGAIALVVPLAGVRRHWARLPAVAAAAIYTPQIAIGDWQALLLPVGAFAVGALALRHLQGARGVMALLTRVTLVAIFVAAFVWRTAPSTGMASLVLSLFFVAMLLTLFVRDAPVATAASLIGASTALFLIMASDTHEALVFCVAAMIALTLSTVRVDVTRPGLVYLLAGVLILLRVCLYFELGDQYSISSIRTAPGFLLSSGGGLPLVSVVGLLLLKYCLPWLVIFAMALPWLAAADRRWTMHLMDLLLIGYVARFAAVGAVIDPFRALPNGMDGIVGMFCVSWAELLTFGIAATLAAILVSGRGPVRAPA